MDTTVNTSLLPTHSEFLPLSIQEQSCLEDFHAELATFSEFQTKLNFLYHQFKTLHAHVSVLTESELSKFHAAARCIQKHWRGYAVRRQFTSPGPNRRHASRWLRKKNGRDLDLQKEIQSLHALLQQSLAWQSKHEKFIQLLACKLIQHHW
ncbi:hypothetical protein HMI54_013062 [Coelomomyces lativittatus]|nr:hypothetical protein HMI54_013062 [Coelomomyces lativittatus]